MVKKPSNSDAFETLLSHFHVDGKRHGAKTALAKALGLSSRAVPDRWERYGVPMKYATKLKELTGMTPDQIWPDNFR